MIVRKPYAFLIKNFKKIHIFLLILCAYIYNKNMQISAFIREFMDLGTYDPYTESINKYASLPAMFLTLLIIAGSLALVLLLRHKEKPWKMYVLPVIEYIAVFISFIAIRSYFANYTGALETATIRALRDIFFITSVIQYPVFALFLMRTLGVDLHKFDFKTDEEYLELSNEDREELEINIDIDKETFKRGFKRLSRNINYVYLEHKFIFNTIFIIILLVLLKNTYTYIFITNKSYNEKETFSTNGYEITVNDSYYTDKDYRGNIITKDSGFIVLDITVINTIEQREMDLNRFHIINGIENYITTQKTYETEFQDFGKTYQTKELKTNEKFNFIIVYKVSKKQSIDDYVLYYQELEQDKSHLRKIKLDVEDVSKIKEEKAVNLREDLTFKVENKTETVSFDSYEIVSNVDYTYRNCTTSECESHTNTYTAKTGEKILKIDFASTNYEGKDMIDFSTKYGKIKYIDSKSKEKVISIKNPIHRVYHGKYIYINVPEEIEKSEIIEILYTVRNKQYTYKLK